MATQDSTTLTHDQMHDAVAALKDEKQKLQVAIGMAVADFRAATGLSVRGIRMVDVSTAGSGTYFVPAEVEVLL